MYKQLYRPERIDKNVQTAMQRLVGIDECIDKNVQTSKKFRQRGKSLVEENGSVYNRIDKYIIVQARAETEVQNRP